MSSVESAPATLAPTASPVASPGVATVLNHLGTWAEAAEPAAFPYDMLLTHLRSVGKHFLTDDLLTRLDEIRAALPGHPESAPGSVRQDGTETRDGIRPQDGTAFLRGFLDVVLDKYDGRYDYPSYTALSLLTRPATTDWRAARRARDEVLLLLLADLVRFEQRALTDTPDDPHGMPPESRLVAKRVRLAVRVMEPAALRALPEGIVDAAAAAAVPGRTPGGRLAADVLRAASPAQSLLLSASVQPVYVLHDEYLFLRTLQSFETTFTFMAAALAAAVRRLDENRPGEAADLVDAVAAVLKESLPLFSLLATMRPEAFRVFRDFTEGASAIQSAGYKTFESLCSTPSLARLASAAYTSVPAVRERVVNGRPTVQGTWHDLIAERRLPAEEAAVLQAAADRLEGVHQRWKQTHYRLAVRMIGERSGTGYTQGVPYLAAVLENRLFPAPDRQGALVG
ncbi:tryptophan 2,3-dioxygenase [Streptomyces sp. NPDC059980]|uniref:tryptophan 2,3-dioxygenase n=1 Tax=Streptomyces sp. NPDC059980 TaxID=3347022 RepID=UPI003695A423